MIWPRSLIFLVLAVLWTASPGAPARADTSYVNYTSILSDSTPAPYPLVYRSIMENFRLHHLRIPFPQGATDVAASYRRFEPRDIYNAVETYSFLEILNGADPSHPLDAGPSAAGDRQKRLHDLIAWNLWLISREGVNYHWNNPAGKKGPWLEGRLRGWGSQNFTNSSSNFSGWHTYSEQTSQPLIGLFQTVMAVEQYIQENPGRADDRIFASGEYDAFRQSGYMMLVTPTVTDDIGLSGCVAAREICRYDYGNLTYRQAAALIRVFGGTVLDWWIAHAMTHHAPLDYFWYTSRGDRFFAATGIPARDWFIVHANMLMGRAAFLYAKLTNDTRYSDIAVQLYRAFLTAHHDCRVEGDALSCYHYGVLGKPLAELVAQSQFGAADPSRITTTPALALEEPYHMNSSQALVGLMSGKSLLNTRDMLEGDGDWLPMIQKTYLAAYRVPGPEEPCLFFTPYQCGNAFVTGTPHIQRKYRFYWDISQAPGASPRETLALNGKTFSVPNYAGFGDALAAFYLTEGASAESFQLLHQWWDAYARRVEFENITTGCAAKRTCRNAFDGSNFPKMGVFLAAAAFQKQGDESVPPSAFHAGAPHHLGTPWACASGGGGAGDWLEIAAVLLFASIARARTRCSDKLLRL